MPIALFFAFLYGALADEQCADQGHQQQQRAISTAASCL
jgi:hypothetical protein